MEVAGFCDFEYYFRDETKQTEKFSFGAEKGFIARRMGQLMFKKHKLANGFLGRVLISKFWRKGYRGV